MKAKILTILMYNVLAITFFMLVLATAVDDLERFTEITGNIALFIAIPGGIIAVAVVTPATLTLGD